MTITPAILARTRLFEGSVPWLYLDALGNVTVGVGHLLSSLTAAQSVAFVTRMDATPATSQQIAIDYSRVQAMAPDLTASAYQSPTSLALAPGMDETLLVGDLKASEYQLLVAFAVYDELPSLAQAALIDMMFNLVPAHFNAQEWPRLFAAVNAWEWNTAAEQSFRTTASPARNIEIATLFRDAERQAST
jgi:GH24 family phage-related lysozyme (muramidase)